MTDTPTPTQADIDAAENIIRGWVLLAGGNEQRWSEFLDLGLAAHRLATLDAAIEVVQRKSDVRVGLIDDTREGEIYGSGYEQAISDAIAALEALKGVG